MPSRVDIEKLREAKVLCVRHDSPMGTACALEIGAAIVALQQQRDQTFEINRLRGQVLALQIEVDQQRELSRDLGWRAA